MQMSFLIEISVVSDKMVVDWKSLEKEENSK